MEKTQTELTAEVLINRHGKETALKLCESRSSNHADALLYQRMAVLILSEGGARQAYLEYCRTVEVPFSSLDVAGTARAAFKKAAEQEFTNERYEYTTHEHASRSDALGLRQSTPDFEAELEAEGWVRVWADVTMEGTLVVYRRDSWQTPEKRAQ